MKKLIKNLFLAIGALIFAAVVLLSTVYFGLSIFGETAFAAELPDIEEPCGLSTEELETVLKYDLKPYAQAFLNAEEDYGINACFLASISALESGWGRYRFKENNIFGFGQKAFDDVEHCIDYVAWYLRKNYLNEEGKYYRGGTIADIGKVWCPDDGYWVRQVSGIYRRMTDVKD